MKKLRLIALLGILLVSTTLVGCDKDKETNTWDIIIEDITASNEVINYNDSLVDITSQFTYTEQRVIDKIKYKFGTIRIYARDYYKNGNLMWSECFIL